MDDRLSKRQWEYFYRHLPEHLFALQEKNPEDRRLQSLIFDSRFQEEGATFLQGIDYLLRGLHLVTQRAAKEQNYHDCANAAILYHQRKQLWLGRSLRGTADSSGLSPEFFRELSLLAPNASSSSVVLLSGILAALSQGNSYTVERLISRLADIGEIDPNEEMAGVVGTVIRNLHERGINAAQFRGGIRRSLPLARWTLAETADLQPVSKELAVNVWNFCWEILRSVKDSVQRAILRRQLGLHAARFFPTGGCHGVIDQIVAETSRDKLPLLQLSALWAGAWEVSRTFAMQLLDCIVKTVPELFDANEAGTVGEDSELMWHLVTEVLTQVETKQDSEHWQQETIFYNHAVDFVRFISSLPKTVRQPMLDTLCQRVQSHPVPPIGQAHGLLIISQALLAADAKNETRTLLRLAADLFQQARTGDSSHGTHRFFTSFTRHNWPVSKWYLPTGLALLGTLQYQLGEQPGSQRTLLTAKRLADEIQHEMGEDTINATRTRVVIAAECIRAGLSSGKSELIKMLKDPSSAIWAACVMSHFPELRERGIESLQKIIRQRVPIQKEQQLLHTTVILRALCHLFPSGRRDLLSDPRASADLTLHPSCIKELALQIIEASFKVIDENDRAEILIAMFDSLSVDGVSPLEDEEIERCVDQIASLTHESLKADAITSLARAMSVHRLCPAIVLRRLDSMSRACGVSGEHPLYALSSMAARSGKLSESSRLLLVSLQCKLQGSESWSKNELLAAIYKSSSESGLGSFARKELLKEAQECDLTIASAQGLARALGRLLYNSPTDLGQELLSILLFRAETLVSYRARREVLTVLCNELQSLETVDLVTILGCRAAWTGLNDRHSDTAIRCLTQMAHILLKLDRKKESMGMLVCGLMLTRRSDKHERPGLLLKLFTLARELKYGRQIILSVLDCLDQVEDYTRLADWINEVIFWMPNVFDPTQEWYDTCCQRILHLARKVGRDFEHWIMFEFHRGHVKAGSWPEAKKEQFDFFMALEEMVPLDALDPNDHISTAANLATASNILLGERAEEWAVDAAYRLLKLQSNIQDTYDSYRSQVIANAAAVLAQRVPYEGQKWLDRVSESDDYLQLAAAISDGCLPNKEVALAFECVPLVIRDESTTSRALANLTELVLSNSLDAPSELTSVSGGLSDATSKAASAVTLEREFLARYTQLFHPQRLYFERLANLLSDEFFRTNTSDEGDDKHIDVSVVDSSRITEEAQKTQRFHREDKSKEFHAALTATKGDLLLRQGDIDGAIANYDEALRCSPQLAQFWAAKGVALLLNPSNWKYLIGSKGGGLISLAKQDIMDDSDLSRSAYSRLSYSLCCLNAATELSPERATTWHNKGGVLTRLRHEEAALRCYDQALRFNPGQDFSVYQRGQLAEELGNERETEQARSFKAQYERRAKTDPADADAKDDLGRACAQSGNYTEALRHFNDALKIDPSRLLTRYGKAKCLHALGKREEAYDLLQKLSSEVPEMLEIQQSLGEVVKELASELCLKASKLATTGDNPEALKTAESVVRMYPSFAIGWYLKGMCELELCQYQDCLTSIEKALNLDTQLAAAWRTKARCLREMGHVREAAEAFVRCLDLDPSDAKSWNDRGTILMELGETDEGTSCLEKAVELMPEHPLHWENLGSALAQRREYDRARQVLQKAIEINGDRYLSWYTLGAIAYTTGQLVEADRCLKKSIELNPQFVHSKDLLETVRMQLANA